MSRPKLLDLFCGAGGCSVGYDRAGFDVTGVDITVMPRYPYEFHQVDAFHYLLEHGHRYDAIHASPPCQDHSTLSSLTGEHGTGWMLAGMQQLLPTFGVPYVIENVPGAPMRTDYKLCGCMFGLPGLRRERWFETSWRGYELRPPCHHTGKTVTVAGHPGGSSTRDGDVGSSTAEWKVAMGIDWMTARELAQAIPPAYTEYIGGFLLNAIAVAA